MNFKRLNIFDVVLINTKQFSDERGYFTETFRQNFFADFVGRKVRFLQENHSFSIKSNTVRGLHYQSPPFTQGKLVRCIQGSIIDVAVDARIGSPTYGHHVTAKLTARNGHQLWVPEGFLHGFSTLVPNTEVQYKCTNYYSPECDGNILWNDLSLGIDWGIDPNDATLSDKDKNAQGFRDFNSPFQMKKA